jgi:hypothetical protein
MRTTSIRGALYARVSTTDQTCDNQLHERLRGGHEAFHIPITQHFNPKAVDTRPLPC